MNIIISSNYLRTLLPNIIILTELRRMGLRLFAYEFAYA